MNQPRGSDEGNPSRPKGSQPDLPPLPPGWAELHIPDDPRELAGESAQLRAELALDPDWPPRRPMRVVPAGPVVALIVMVTIAVASLLTIVHPIGNLPPRAAPLATSPETPGSIGGLLPDLTLWDASHKAVQANSLRPTMLLLVPSECDCADLTARLVDATRSSLVQVNLVGRDGLPELPAGAVLSRTRSLLDPAGTLGDTITPPPSTDVAPPTAITAVLVRSDGLIARILRNPAPSPQLQNDLASLSIR